MRFPLFLLLVIVVIPVCQGCYPGDEEKFDKIDLKEVYFTTRQDGLKQVGANHSEDLDRLLGKWGGASNLLLVKADSIDGAIKETNRVFLEAARGTGYALEGARARAWMAVYLGISGSEPSAFTIHSVERSQKRVRVYFRPGIAESRDLRRYYAWIPLGELAAGKYELELWNQGTGERTLSRMCVITETK